MWNSVCMGPPSDFVRLSAGILCEGRYVRVIYLISTCSQMKWWAMSMCLEWTWYEASFFSDIVPWLSQCSMVSPSVGTSRQVSRFLSHNASSTQWLVAMYSASQEDATMVCCFFELQDITPLPSVNRYLSRTGFPIRLKHRKVEIGQEKMLWIDVERKLSVRAVVKERRLRRLSLQGGRWTTNKT